MKYGMMFFDWDWQVGLSVDLRPMSPKRHAVRAALRRQGHVPFKLKVKMRNALKDWVRGSLRHKSNIKRNSK